MAATRCPHGRTSPAGGPITATTEVPVITNFVHPTSWDRASTAYRRDLTVPLLPFPHAGLDDGIPSAADLGEVNTFSPTHGSWPNDSDPSLDTITNMLSSTSQADPPKAPPTHIGEGLPPVPSKLPAKVLLHKFVEMHELLPELWHKRDGAKPADRTRAKNRALDITVWLQCFSIYVGVLGPQSPLEVPELMAYMIAIVRASQEYEGTGCIRRGVQTPGSRAGAD